MEEIEIEPARKQQFCTQICIACTRPVCPGIFQSEDEPLFEQMSELDATKFYFPYF